MGKGVGAIKDWVVLVKRGMIILEVDQVKKELGMKALQAAILRLPIQVYIISRDVLVA